MINDNGFYRISFIKGFAFRLPLIKKFSQIVYLFSRDPRVCIHGQYFFSFKKTQLYRNFAKIWLAVYKTKTIQLIGILFKTLPVLLCWESEIKWASRNWVTSLQNNCLTIYGRLEPFKTSSATWNIHCNSDAILIQIGTDFVRRLCQLPTITWNNLGFSLCFCGIQVNGKNSSIYPSLRWAWKLRIETTSCISQWLIR